MKLLRHGVASLVLFVGFISLIIIIYNGLQTGYQFTPSTYVLNDGTTTTEGIMEQFQDLYLLKSINSLQADVTNINTGNFIDLLGGLSAGAVGVITSIIGLIAAPFQILFIINKYYFGTFPAGVITTLVSLVTVYAIFILLSAHLKKDI